jgi:hypothetical protein
MHQLKFFIIMETTNLFNFDYENVTIKNKDNTDSRFGYVYGQKGMVMHTKKDSYTIVDTIDLSRLAQAFIDKGYTVTPFTHKFGEVIGLNICLSKNKMTKVGDKTYNAIITVPNNGIGMGYLLIFENRLICENGATKKNKLGAFDSLKIPHNITYKLSLELMEKALVQFESIIELIEQQDEILNAQEIDENEAMKLLNVWFFENEFPTSQKNGLTLDEFRKALAVNPEEIKCIDRYNELKMAFKRELGYNERLNLKLSKYTIFATITNYLSRRAEKSNSKAPAEIVMQRQEAKIEGVLKLLEIGVN